MHFQGLSRYFFSLTYIAGVILPDNTELNNALGDGDDLEGLAVLRLLLEESGVLEGGSELCSGNDMIS